MGFFDKFKKNEKIYTVKKSIFDCGIEIEKSNYFKLFSACLGKVLSNQMACNKIVVRDRNWNVDFSKGIISFGNDPYPLQLIGSESTVSNTWLWGWANKSQLPDTVLAEAFRLKEIGDIYEIEVLKTPQFELTDTINGHNLSIISAALNQNNVCYYRGPHQNGAIFIEFSDIPEEVFIPISAIDFTNTTMKAIQQFDVDHKIFVCSFLYQNNTPHQWSEDNLVANFNDQKLRICFEKADEFWRICSIKSIT